MPASPTRDRHTLTQAAALIGISARTLTGWIKAKKVRVTRMSARLVYVDSAEIERLRRGAEVGS